MIEVTVKNPGDEYSLDQALGIFKKKCNKDGFLREIKDRRYYKKPSEIKREKRNRPLES